MIAPIRSLSPIPGIGPVRFASPVPGISPAPMAPIIPYMGPSPMNGAVPLLGGPYGRPSIMHFGTPPLNPPVLVTGFGMNVVGNWKNNLKTELQKMKNYLNRGPDAYVNKPNGQVIWVVDELTHVLHDRDNNYRGIDNYSGTTPTNGIISTTVRLKTPLTGTFPPAWWNGVTADGINNTITVTSNSIGNNLYKLCHSVNGLNLKLTTAAEPVFDNDNKGIIDLSKFL